jgi:uncharacterized protein (DUF305 family)
MNRFVLLGIALVVSFSIGWGVGVTSKPASAAGQTSTASAQPMPMSSMPMGGMQNCDQMHAMMQAHSKSPADQAYMQAMMSMHQSMMKMQLTGDADHDFMVMMIPHHQSAIGMAKAELQYGKDARVRGLATNVISAQQKEINEMQTWLAGMH